MMTHARKILPLAALLALAGCKMVEPLMAPIQPVAMPATVVSYSVLGKSPVDYAMSQIRNQDCDVRNPKKYDGMYCVNPYVPPSDPTTYCYRTLGDTECSDRLDPYGNNNRPIVGGPRSSGNGRAITADRNSGPTPITPVAETKDVAPLPKPLTDSDKKERDPAIEGS